MSNSVILQFGFIGGSMSGGEILLILLAALLLFGSKNLPSIARNIGKSLESFRRASREVTDEIMRADLDLDKPHQSRKTEPVKQVAPPAAEKPQIEVKPTAHSVKRDESSQS